MAGSGTSAMPRWARRLVEDSLLLEPLLAARLVGLSGGSPRFLLQVVQDWVLRGQLASTPEGFVLRDPDSIGLPGDLTQLFLGRLEPLEEGNPVPLEVAAALGARFDREDWLALCPEMGAVASRATEAGLLAPTRTGWRFQVGAVREVLAQRARDEGRWESHHARCVRMIGVRVGAPVRLGRHLLESGSVGRAFELLYEEAQQARLAGRGQEALQLADLSSKALGGLSPSEDDERLGQQLLLECRLLWDLADIETLFLRAGRLLERARRQGWQVLEGEALRFRALAKRARRDRTCEEDFRAALAVYVAIGEPRRACRVQGDLCNLCCVFGRVEEAEVLGSLAVEGARRLGDTEGLALSLLARSLARERLGRLEEALTDAEEGHAIAVSQGVALWQVNGLTATTRVLYELGRLNEARVGLERLAETQRERLNLRALATTLNRLGDLEREQGHPDAAERYYREVVDMGRLIGHNRHFARLNLGLLLLQVGRPSQVVPMVSPVEDHAVGIGHQLLEACAGSLLCWAHASLGDGRSVVERLDRIEVLLEHLGMPDGDLAVALEEAGHQALAHVDRPTAIRALSLAARVYELRGDSAAATACRGLIG